MTMLRALTSMIAILTVTSSLIAAEAALDSRPIVTAKETDNRIEVVKTFLRPRAVDGRVKVWVFFTDKDVFDKAEFDRTAASVTLTDRAWTRRAKMGLDHVTFADLPVPRRYLAQVETLGGKLRRVSRWLDAASFDLPLSQLDAVNSLPFVARVRPVATYIRDNETAPDEFPAPSFSPSSGYSLSYGQSLGQLNQIHVPAVHDQGFNGSGVLVAMFDTGYRKDHLAFAQAYTDNRVLAEYDFIFNDSQTANEPIDDASQWNHGTYTWSTLGGAMPGVLYGPAYGASFILAKTEYIPTETQIEEDNWARAVEWADSLGADVISSSLAYSDWYTYASFDGQTAVTTIAANIATSYGIVVCNAMGNAGPNAGTLIAPADAFDIISCGAVNSGGTIASFSSRGPTYDGRTKPEVCAQGVSTYCASSGSTSSYAFVNGTSLSTPLVGGCAALLLSARPSLTPHLVRLALMQTASLAGSPNNTYGWGIIDLSKAIDWGTKLGADVKTGQVPLTVSFVDSSYVSTASWSWTFGDAGSSTAQNPSHTYTQPGGYQVSLAIVSDGRTLTATTPNYIIALADTITYEGDSVYAGLQAVATVNLANSQPLNRLDIPLDFARGSALTLDSISVAGTRTEGYTKSLVTQGSGDTVVIRLISPGAPLPAGSGPVLKFYLTTDPYAVGKSMTPLDSATVNGLGLRLTTPSFGFVPMVWGGRVVIRDVKRGDANHDDAINIGDAVSMVNYVFRSGPAPITIEAGDANSDTFLNIGDAIFVVNYVFKDGPAPVDN